jgi:hypothetical protein
VTTSSANITAFASVIVTSFIKHLYVMICVKLDPRVSTPASMAPWSFKVTGALKSVNAISRWSYSRRVWVGETIPSSGHRLPTRNIMDQARARTKMTMTLIGQSIVVIATKGTLCLHPLMLKLHHMLRV